MKIKLTENKLKQIVAKSVKKVLKEDGYIWYGDTNPFEEIYHAASQIVQKLEHVNNEDYWEDVDDYSYSTMYKWAVKVRDAADYYISNHSSNSPINGGEDW